MYDLDLTTTVSSYEILPPRELSGFRYEKGKVLLMVGNSYLIIIIRNSRELFAFSSLLRVYSIYYQDLLYVQTETRKIYSSINDMVHLLCFCGMLTILALENNQCIRKVLTRISWISWPLESYFYIFSVEATRILSIRFPLQQQRLGGPQGMTIDWKPPGSPSSFLVKRVLRLDIPVDRYPNVSLWKSLFLPLT